MQHSSFRIVSVAISTILLAALLAVIVLAVRDNPSSALPRQLTELADTERSPAASTGTGAVVQPVADLGQPVAVEGGGFRVRAPAGYTLETTQAAATLVAGVDSPAAGAEFALDGGPRSRYAAGAGETPEAVFGRLAADYAGAAAMAVGSPAAIRVAGLEGLTAPLIGERGMGQIVVLQPGDDQIFTMAGMAPAEVWEGQAAADFLAVLNAVEFFAPEAAAEPVAAAATPPAATPPAATPPAAAQPSPTPRATGIPSPTPPKTGAIAAVGTPAGQATVAVPDAAPDAAPDTSPDVVPDEARPAAVATPRAGGETIAASIPGPAATPRVFSNGNFVNSVAVMRSTVWAATGGGVVAWNKSSGGYVKFMTPDGLATNRTVAAVACPLPGLGVLFGSDAGIQTFDTQNGRWRAVDSANSGMSYDDVSALWCDPDAGTLVVGYSRHGLELFDATADTWTYLGPDAGLDVTGIRALDVTRDGSTIWLATDQGLVSYADEAFTFYTTANSPLQDDRVETLAVDGSGAVWLATGNTLYRTDGTEWDAYSADTAAPADFPNGRITGVDVSEEGAIWIGSDQAQVCRFDPGIEGCIAFYSGEDGMATAPLTSLTIGVDGEVYYTTAGGGVSLFDGTAWRQFFMDNEVVPGNTVRDLAQDADGALWVVGVGGASRIDPEEEAGAQWFNPANSPLPAADVRVVQPGIDGAMWFGSEGVTLYDGAAWTTFTTDDGLAGATVQAIAIDDRTRTWIGTQSGLSIWTGSAFFNLTTDNGLPSDDITALLAQDDIIWIGTRGGGLLRFQENQLQVFTRENIGLPSNVITALALDAEGVLFVGTDRGLASFQDSEMTPLAEFADMPVSALAAGAGKVWVATADSALFYTEGDGWLPFATAHLPGRPITTLLVDSAGGLWVGCDQGGLAYFGP